MKLKNKNKKNRKTLRDFLTFPPFSNLSIKSIKRSKRQRGRREGSGREEIEERRRKKRKGRDIRERERDLKAYENGRSKGLISSVQLISSVVVCFAFCDLMTKTLIIQKLLKDLMEKQKQQTMPLNSRIQHPLASCDLLFSLVYDCWHISLTRYSRSYDKSNKLTCVVCKIVIHSESVWDIHLRTKLHIAAVVDLKAKHQKKLDQQLMPPPSLPLKKIGTPYQPNSAVSSPNQLPKDFFSSQSSSLSSPSPSLQRLPDDFFSASLAPTSDQLSERSPKPEGLFSGYSDSDSSPEDRGETIDSAEEEEQEQVEVVRVQRKSGLTLDQIRQIQLELEQEESLLSHAEQESKESRGRNTLQTQLPSGFFDSSTGHSISEPHTIEYVSLS